ncbi:MAG: helix-turn-helix domain-containing protein [Asticcacaulis sp.]
MDRHVGLKVRLRRKSMGLSQTELADAIGLTFQQVQKYERGSNRISASKMFEISRVLRCNVAYFFEGFEDQGEFTPSPVEEGVNSFLFTPEGLELARAFPHIRSTRVRRKILDLVTSLANIAEAAPDMEPA